MNKVVLQVELLDDKTKKKAMKAVSKISGVESVSMEMKEQKLTLIGDMDAVVVVEKLRKLCYTEILSYGPAKVEKKDNKKEAEKKEPAEKKNKDQTQNIADILKTYETYHNHYHYTSYVEENPNACVIC
ncbi:heavy metal-associated isoprenylated plant protein 39-like [Vigna radiata var. radiata]|uniref:Heavy metal-associated isoprenylated plant protein 39-like n=1 Tax=Vigna radiata var. radiata TaxID=3916 RepID=A0A1S3V4R9_VIGRR|nr:heavy metal-associated isoprenylated plant protein 39-like [Vigna radiata var. radiata]